MVSEQPERGEERRGGEGRGGEERFVILMWFPSSCSLTFVFEPSSKVFGYSAHPLEPGGASIVSVLHYGVLVCIHYCTHTTVNCTIVYTHYCKLYIIVHRQQETDYVTLYHSTFCTIM